MTSPAVPVTKAVSCPNAKQCFQMTSVQNSATTKTTCGNELTTCVTTPRHPKRALVYSRRRCRGLASPGCRRLQRCREPQKSQTAADQRALAPRHRVATQVLMESSLQLDVVATQVLMESSCLRSAQLDPAIPPAPEASAPATQEFHCPAMAELLAEKHSPSRSPPCVGSRGQDHRWRERLQLLLELLRLSLHLGKPARSKLRSKNHGGLCSRSGRANLRRQKTWQGTCSCSTTAMARYQRLP